MAVQETIPEHETVQYTEPHPPDLKPLETDQNDNERICSITSGLVTVEPVQAGVRRYPPVQVDVDRRPDFIERYIIMQPTVWSEHILPLETKKTAGPVRLLDLLIRKIRKPSDSKS